MLAFSCEQCGSAPPFSIHGQENDTDSQFQAISESCGACGDIEASTLDLACQVRVDKWNRNIEISL